MATLYITEFVRQGRDGRAAIPAGEEPAVASQTVAIGGASAQSAALNVATRFVEIHADAICSIKFGANPTATAADMRLAAGDRIVRAVEEKAVIDGLKIAVITNS